MFNIMANKRPFDKAIDYLTTAIHKNINRQQSQWEGYTNQLLAGSEVQEISECDCVSCLGNTRLWSRGYQYTKWLNGYGWQAIKQ